MSIKETEKDIKIEEQKMNISSLLRKIEKLESKNPLVKKELLGLIPGKIYLIITEGRRIVSTLEFENKSFICYSKRGGTRYYANKRYIRLIKEMSEKEQESYFKSNIEE